MSIDVSTPVFEGPFDLLLSLIAKEQVDLYEISLSHIVDAFLREIGRMESLDLEVATEFLLIAATLVELKLRRLLPERATVDLDEELALLEERDLLLAKLLEYQTFRGAAAYLRRLEGESAQSYPRTNVVEDRFVEVTADPLAGSTPEQLRDAFRRAVSRLAFPKELPRVRLDHVTPVRVTVAEAVAELAQALPRLGRATFRVLTVDVYEPAEIIVRFLAVLELYKQGWVELDQVTSFGDLHVVWRPEGPGDFAVDVVLGSLPGLVAFDPFDEDDDDDDGGDDGSDDGSVRDANFSTHGLIGADEEPDGDEEAEIEAELDASLSAAREARLSLVAASVRDEGDDAGEHDEFDASNEASSTDRAAAVSFVVDDYEG